MKFHHPNPQEGERRVRRAFLWWPRTIGNETRWLERAAWVEEWDREDGWEAIRWGYDDPNVRSVQAGEFIPRGAAVRVGPDGRVYVASPRKTETRGASVIGEAREP